MVLVAFPSEGNGGLNRKINPKFGRCESFTFVLIEDNEIQAVKSVVNYNSKGMGGVGIQSAKIIGYNNADEIVVVYLGPNAFQSLNSLGITVYQAPDQQLTIKECVNLYLKEELQIITKANIETHHGMHANGKK